ncbi:MAG: branched-chain amino acid aminotransferase [Gemmatimonadota bacterium]|nr:branched-chain amino acid aminotransferase [Gemmatimonadota bacterium]
MDIKVVISGTRGQKPRPENESELGFGQYFTDHMFKMDYREGAGWFDPRIVPYGPLNLDPAAMIFHYNQEVFEGLKAYLMPDGGTALFRPDKNISRMNKSLRRMTMPEIDPGEYLKALKELIWLERDWIPASEGTALYVRPTAIATEAALGVRTAKEYLFYIILSPVGPFYKEGFNPTKIYVADEFIRSARGGSGAAKTSGNYGPTLSAANKAREKGFTQVLWLDAVEHKYIEEVGTSNIFFVIGDELVTPPTGGTILDGVTRDSVIQIARHQGKIVSDRAITIDEVIDGITSGRVKEIFASGTAAVISPVGLIGYREETYTINNGETGAVARSLYEELTGIQSGHREDPFGWVVRINGSSDQT